LLGIPNHLETYFIHFALVSFPIKMVQSAALLFLLAGLCLAEPIAAPQGMNFDAIAKLPPPPTYTVAVGVAAQTVIVNKARIMSSIIAEIAANPSTKVKRQASATCSGGAVQPTGSGPVSTPDTPAGFQANPAYAAAASSAATPSGYTLAFRNLNASTQGYAYLGFTTLTSYAPASCASQCTLLSGCHAVDICKAVSRPRMFLCLTKRVDFERDPSTDPAIGGSCSNPSSTTLIK